MDDLINSQKNILGLSEFLQSASNYTKETFPDLDINNLFTSAISRQYNNKFLDKQYFRFCSEKK